MYIYCANYIQRSDEAILEQAEFEVSEQVQYWSESRDRWMDAVVEGVRVKDRKVVYDLTLGILYIIYDI